MVDGKEIIRKLLDLSVFIVILSMKIQKTIIIMKRLSSLFIVLIAMSLSVFADTYPATSTDVCFTGRVLANTDGSVSYDWVGVYMQTQFEGTSVAVVVADNGISYHNVFIDGMLIEKIKIEGNEPQTVILASKLKKGTHTLRLQKCTEGQNGLTTLYSVVTDRGCRLHPVQQKARFIEVIGDSYTCGYGTESNRAEDHFSVDTENCNKAYGCMVAEYFDADYMLTAHSGQGMCHDWGDSVQVSTENMLTRYTQVFDMRQDKVYDFSRRPDIVLINLGTNDWGAGYLPSIEQYVGNYIAMLNKVRANNGDVPVLCITPHSANPFLLAALGELRKQIAGMPHVHMANPMPNIVIGAPDFGADWHPNYQGQRKIAFTLIPQISTIMKWPMK